MDHRYNLDFQPIYDTEFHTDFKGYSAKEVDELLDLVIEDYQTYDEVISKMSQDALLQERTIASLKAQVIELEGKMKALEEAEPANVSQLDILKRLSRLEQEVYKKDKF